VWRSEGRKGSAACRRELSDVGSPKYESIDELGYFNDL
jgi:hypothetical protein